MYNTLFKISTLLLFVSTLFLSCSSDKKDDRIWIKELKIMRSGSINPAAVVFNIHTNSELKELFLSEKWDSIKFSGGFFDTINFNNRIIRIVEPENKDELILGMSLGRFSRFTYEQLDSIVFETLKEVEINVYYEDKHWTLKPLEKKEDMVFSVQLSEEMYKNNWIEKLRITHMLFERYPSVFFTVHTNNVLKELLLAKRWDSIKFSGGVFDTINFNNRIIDIEKSENHDELILRIATNRFLTLTTEEVDSIVSSTLKELEIDIYYKDYHWTLKPLEDSVPDWSYLN